MKRQRYEYDIAYGCFFFCGLAAIGIISVILIIDFTDAGTAAALGFGVLMPLSITTLIAMLIGITFSIRLRQHWPLVFLSIMPVFLLAGLLTEYCVAAFYNVAPIIYGIVAVAFSAAWFIVLRKRIGLEMPSTDNPPLNPWFSIWMKPRATIQQIVDTNPKRMILVLVVVAGFLEELNRASMRNMGDKLEGPIFFVIAAIAAPIGGLIALYIGSALLRWTGSWIGGQASSVHIRAAVAWSSIPIIWASTLWIPKLALFGQELFTSVTPRIDANPSLAFFLLGFMAVETTIGIWAFVIFLKCLGQVQNFSAWKTLGNIIVSSLIIVIPIVVIFFGVIALVKKESSNIGITGDSNIAYVRIQNDTLGYYRFDNTIINNVSFGSIESGNTSQYNEVSTDQASSVSIDIYNSLQNKKVGTATESDWSLTGTFKKNAYINFRLYFDINTGLVKLDITESNEAQGELEYIVLNEPKVQVKNDTSGLFRFENVTVNNVSFNTVQPGESSDIREVQSLQVISLSMDVYRVNDGQLTSNATEANWSITGSFLKGKIYTLRFYYDSLRDLILLDTITINQ